jgi:uncharacterized protein (DUF488 family)
VQPSNLPLHTIGHSTRSIDELVELLTGHGIGLLADVRRYPGSKRYPHFSSEAMARWLPEHGVSYIHMPELGGRRKPLADSPNTAWRNEQFRAYADYMASDEFRAAIDKLLALAAAQRAAVMCAEAVPWRCHRNLIADELTRRGVEVFHIISGQPAKMHVMNEHARVEGDHLVYSLVQRAEQQTLRL